jgi:hypothetical protein
MVVNKKHVNVLINKKTRCSDILAKISCKAFKQVIKLLNNTRMYENLQFEILLIGHPPLNLLLQSYEK